MSRTMTTSIRMNSRRLKTRDAFEQLTYWFFILTFVLKAFTDGIFVSLGMKGAITDSKYLTMGGVIFFGLCYMIERRRFGIFFSELKKLLTVVVVFIVMTCVLIIYRGQFGTWQIRDVLNLLSPILVAYTVLNTLKPKQILKGLKIALISSILGYVIQLLIRGVTFADIMATSYTDSTSALESHDFAATSIMFCFFFCYYRSERLYTVLSVLFAIATFKRLAIIFAIIALVLPLLIDMNKYLPRWAGVICKIVFFAASMIYLYFMLPGSPEVMVFGKSLTEQSMGRSGFLYNLLTQGYQTFGYGSTEATLGHSMEMYFVRLSLELSPFAVLLFINNYWDLTRGNRYCVLLMVFEFLNLITADSISAMFAWVVLYLTIGFIIYFHKEVPAPRPIGRSLAGRRKERRLLSDSH